MKLLITGAWRHTEEQLNMLEAKNNEIVLMADERGELPCNADGIEGVICNGLFLYHDIKKFTSLKYIQLTSAGFDRIDMDYVNEHNIEIHNARGVYSIPMAEYAVFGVLELYKQGKFFIENQKSHLWEKHRGLLELYGKTVCIVGCGNVGTECAKRFKAFGCNVIGVDLYTREDNDYEKIYSLSKLDNILQGADIVVLTLPLTKETEKLISKEKLAIMKNGAVLVNIARGAIVDENALADALKTHLYGAVLDVFGEEPLNENSPLWDMENVILTPHNSFVGENNGERLWQVIKDNLER